MTKEYGGLIINPSCANYCLFCGNTKTSKEELRRQEVNIAKNLIEFKKKGVEKIEISGADPIEYKGIIKLVRYIKRMGFKFIQLSTHGRKLSDEFFLSSLVAAGISKLRIPLYGTRPEIHDAITRAKGSFKETYKGIETLRKKMPFVNLQISNLIMQDNKDDLIDFVRLMKKLKINNTYISIPLISNEDILPHYIPYKNLGPYVKKVYKYAKKINYPLRFMEIPYCLFGCVDELINNISLPPDLGKYCQPPKTFRTFTKDLPSYRFKKKISICYQCKCENFCDGFVANDIDKFGLGKIKPIKK